MAFLHFPLPDDAPEPPRRPTGHDLRACRERLGLTVDELAELLLATAEEVEHWERTGCEAPVAEGWERVERGLGGTEEGMVGGGDVPERGGFA